MELARGSSRLSSSSASSASGMPHDISEKPPKIGEDSSKTSIPRMGQRVSADVIGSPRNQPGIRTGRGPPSPEELVAWGKTKNLSCGCARDPGPACGNTGEGERTSIGGIRRHSSSRATRRSSAPREAARSGLQALWGDLLRLYSAILRELSAADWLFCRGRDGTPPRLLSARGAPRPSAHE